MFLFYRIKCLVLTKLKMLKKTLKIVLLLKSKPTPLSSHLKLWNEWIVSYFRLLLNHSANPNKSLFTFLWRNMKKPLFFIGTSWNNISFTLFRLPEVIKTLGTGKSTRLHATELHLGIHLCLWPYDMTATGLHSVFHSEPPTTVGLHR